MTHSFDNLYQSPFDQRRSAVMMMDSLELLTYFYRRYEKFFLIWRQPVPAVIINQVGYNLKCLEYFQDVKVALGHRLLCFTTGVH